MNQSPTNLVRTTCSPIGTGSVADVRQQGHEAGAFDGAGDGMLARGVATGFAAADNSPVPIGELAQQVEVLVIDVHRARGAAADVDRVPLGRPLDIRLTLVLVAAAGLRFAGIGHGRDRALKGNRGKLTSRSHQRPRPRAGNTHSTGGGLVCQGASGPPNRPF